MDDDDDNDEEEKKAAEDSPSPGSPAPPPSSRSPPFESFPPARLGRGANAGVRFRELPADNVCGGGGDDGFVSHARAEKRAATFRSDLFFLIPLLPGIFIARDALLALASK